MIFQCEAVGRVTRVPIVGGIILKDRRHAINLFILLLAGMIIGGFIGHYLGQYPQFSFLNYGKVFGTTDSPISLELGIIHLVLGITININIAGVIGMALGGLVFKQLQR